MIRFGPDICQDLDAALAREWLETNGLGGFASSTIVGLNTRTYHGLLISAETPPVRRFLLLAKLEESLLLPGRRYELSCNEFPGAIHPRGERYLREFRLDPFPIFTYEVEGVRLEKSVFLIPGENTVAVSYEFDSSPPAGLELELRPLVAFRDIHATTHENPALNRAIRSEAGLASVEPYSGLPALYFAHGAKQLEPVGLWYRSFLYREERQRGCDFEEDLFCPFLLRFDPDRPARVLTSTGPCGIGRFDDARRAQRQRRSALVAGVAPEKELEHALAEAADQFFASRGGESTVLAGYHWFADWGRDTMIALPGLSRGRPEKAKSVLKLYGRFIDGGLIPNRFPDSGEEPEYNTADASLWFIEAARDFLETSGETDFVRRELYEPLCEIARAHRRGTRHGIRVDSDGLLSCGEEGLALTWMDARVAGRAITPRRGKPVEIQALWYNAVRSLEEMAGAFGDAKAGREFGDCARAVEQSFEAAFWNAQGGYLYDVVDGADRDASVRPNQVLALSLAHPLVTGAKAESVLKVVERELLTPFGLRSLSPKDPAYRGRYEGGPESRDSAYHEGTVWAWLLGPYVRAVLRNRGDSPAARLALARRLEPFREHLRIAGLNQVSEIFDGDPPHAPRGCIAQAWSVAELVRLSELLS
jgi:predicted glycogen debranching enzyme